MEQNEKLILARGEDAADQAWKTLEDNHLSALEQMTKQPTTIGLMATLILFEIGKRQMARRDDGLSR